MLLRAAIRSAPDHRQPDEIFPGSATNGVNCRLGQKTFGAAIAVDEHLDVIFIHRLPQQMLETSRIGDVGISLHPQPGFIAFLQQTATDAGAARQAGDHAADGCFSIGISLIDPIPNEITVQIRPPDRAMAGTSAAHHRGLSSGHPRLRRNCCVPLQERRNRRPARVRRWQYGQRTDPAVRC